MSYYFDVRWIVIIIIASILVYTTLPHAQVKQYGSVTGPYTAVWVDAEIRTVP